MTVVLIQDFPSTKAGQNGPMSDWGKVRERKRTRELAAGVAANAEVGERFMAGERLSCRVSVLRKKNRRNIRMDLFNVPGMIKGYLDGFTDAGLWGDDSQVVDFRICWMTAGQGEAWLRLAGVEDEGRGLLVFEIERIEDRDGKNDSESEAAIPYPAGGDAGVHRGGDRDEAGGCPEIPQDGLDVDGGD